MKKTTLFILLAAFSVEFLFAQTDTLATVIFQKTDAEALENMAGLWNWISLVAVLIALVLAGFGLKKAVGIWAEEQAMKSFAQKINVKTEHLEFAMKRMAQEYEQRSKSKILVVSQTSGQLLALEAV